MLILLSPSHRVGCLLVRLITRCLRPSQAWPSAIRPLSRFGNPSSTAMQTLPTCSGLDGPFRHAAQRRYESAVPMPYLSGAVPYYRFAIGAR